MDLIYKNEKQLFTISMIVSSLFWVSIVLGTVGVALLYLLIGYVFFLFTHSAFISHLKGSGVKIDVQQYPDLHQSLVNGCRKVGLKDVPEAYLLRTDFFNALATKFLGRHFVVLFTDVVDALDDQPGALDFYIGHEIGHIHRKHLNWSTFLFPASILPILGSAYRRAQEYSCDRHGVACCQNEDDVKAALAAMAAGDTRWKTINIDAYLQQVELTSGFWMSFNELTSDYPWLTKRMATSLAQKQGREIKHPKRHGFAWFLSLFIPRLGIAGGGLVSLMMMVAIIGVLAAVAIPAYQDYLKRAQHQTAYQQGIGVQKRVNDFYLGNGDWPTTMLDLGYSDVIQDTKGKFSIDIYEDGMVAANMGTSAEGETQYLILNPSLVNDQISWSCSGENIMPKLLPQPCR